MARDVALDVGPALGAENSSKGSQEVTELKDLLHNPETWQRFGKLRMVGDG